MRTPERTLPPARQGRPDRAAEPRPTRRRPHVQATLAGGISRRLIFVFAIACGLVVANLYYAQPMLATIAHDFHTTSGSVGQIVTLSQIGFAVGLLFILPLGDRLDRRRLIAAVLGATMLGLVLSALAPSLGVLIFASLVVGVTSVVAQILVPFAAALARDDERGRVVGTVMSGLLIGILLSRTFAGLLSEAWGWRAVFGIAAGITLVTLCVLWLELPEAPRTAGTLPYWQLIRSVGTLIRTEPLLRRRSVYGALVFAAFSVLWTSIAFLLARPPYGWNDAEIGLFGLVGVAGALAASFAGRFADNGYARVTTGVFLASTVGAFVLIGFGQVSIGVLIAGTLLLDLGVQGTHITNQSEIYRLHPEARSRITTAYMVCYFIGGSAGSALSAVLYSTDGWAGVSILGAVFGALGLLLWLTESGPWHRTSAPNVIPADDAR